MQSNVCAVVVVQMLRIVNAPPLVDLVRIDQVTMSSEVESTGRGMSLLNGRVSVVEEVRTSTT